MSDDVTCRFSALDWFLSSPRPTTRLGTSMVDALSAADMPGNWRHCLCIRMISNRRILVERIAWHFLCKDKWGMSDDSASCMLKSQRSQRCEKTSDKIILHREHQE